MSAPGAHELHSHHSGATDPRNPPPPPPWTSQARFFHFEFPMSCFLAGKGAAVSHIVPFSILFVLVQEPSRKRAPSRTLTPPAERRSGGDSSYMVNTEHEKMQTAMDTLVAQAEYEEQLAVRKAIEEAEQTKKRKISEATEKLRQAQVPPPPETAVSWWIHIPFFFNLFLAFRCAYDGNVF